jgi:hypothetical protein
MPLRPARQAVAIPIKLAEALDRACVPEEAVAPRRLCGGGKDRHKAQEHEEKRADLEGLVHIERQSYVKSNTSVSPILGNTSVELVKTKYPEAVTRISQPRRR